MPNEFLKSGTETGIRSNEGIDDGMSGECKSSGEIYFAFLSDRL
jgi:hypothetical protein